MLAVSHLSSHQTPLYASKSSCSRSIESTNVAGRGLFPSIRTLLGITFMKRLHCFFIHLGDFLHIPFCNVSMTFSFSETHAFRTFILFRRKWEVATPEDSGTYEALYRMTAHRRIVTFDGRPLRYQAGQPKHFRADPGIIGLDGWDNARRLVTRSWFHGDHLERFIYHVGILNMPFCLCRRYPPSEQDHSEEIFRSATETCKYMKDLQPT